MHYPATGQRKLWFLLGNTGGGVLTVEVTASNKSGLGQFTGQVLEALQDRRLTLFGLWSPDGVETEFMSFRIGQEQSAAILVPSVPIFSTPHGAIDVVIDGTVWTATHSAGGSHKVFVGLEFHTERLAP